MHFCNLEIPGLGRRLSRDSGLAKTAMIPGFGIPGLQSVLWVSVNICLLYTSDAADE